MVELKHYGVSVGAVQFISDLSRAEGHTLLHSGRPLPSNSESIVLREDVEILLDERAMAALRAAGEAWEVVYTRLVTTQL